MERPIKLDDSYLKSMSDYIHNISTDAQKMFDEYYDIMKKMRDEAVLSGQSAQTLEKFNTYIVVLKEKIDDVGVSIADMISSYLSEIDENDKYLY